MSLRPSPSDHYPLDRFLNASLCYGPSFSPDGTAIAFVADLAGLPQAWMIPASGGWPDRLTFAGDRVGLVAYAPRSHRLLVATDAGGDENVQLWLLDPSDGVIQALTRRPDAMHLFGSWSPDGRAIAYTQNERDCACLDVVVHDVETGEVRVVLETAGMHTVEGWSPDGRRLLVSRIDSSSENDLFEVEIRTGESHLLTTYPGVARFVRARYAPDGQKIYALTDLDRDFLTLRELDRSTGAWRPIVEDEWDVEEYALAPEGHRIAVVTNIEGYSIPIVVDLQTGQRQPVEVPRGVIARTFVGNWGDRVVWSPDSRRLAFSLTTARLTQNVWLADPREGVAWPITHATVGGIPTETFVEPEVIHYPTFDSRAIPAFLYRSPGTRPDGQGAALVWIHGGPESQSRPAFDPIVQYLAHRGYTVLAPNVRGSTGYGNAYTHLDDVDRRLDAVADAKAAADWLVMHGHARRDKVAAMGGSYGGFMVLASLATYPESWAAGVDLYGIANFVTLLQNTHPFRRTHRSAEYGSLEEHRELLERISPITHARRITAPLFVVHGENDVRVPISETEQIVDALRRRGVPVDFVRLPNEGHGIVRLENKLTVYPAIVEFLDRYVKSR